jgi:ATP-binding cassette, subfamily C, bacterial LapB
MAVSQKANAQPTDEFAHPDGQRHDDPLLDCLVLLTRLHGRPVSGSALAAGLPLRDHLLTPALLVRAAENQDYTARVLKRPVRRVSNLVLPAVALLKDGGACVVTRMDVRSGQVEALFPETGMGKKVLPMAELKDQHSGYWLFAHPRPRIDNRMGESVQESPGSWFWGTLWRFRRYYLEAMVSAATINVLALATSLFIMNVYDRVVPNNALETLVVLAVGTGIAIGFEFLARNLRGYFIDVSGKKADLLLAGRLFQQALALRMEVRPGSPGAFASQLREFETLRDFFSSATLTTFSDLPFVFFFIWVISLIGGPVYLVPLLAVPVVVGVGLIAQIPLAYIMNRHMRETALRHGVLVESVEGMETLKTLSAQAGQSAAQSRMISSLVINFAALVQQSVTVFVVIWGVNLIGEGELTVGALIACVILAGRTLAPLSQVAGLLARYQHARAAYFMLDGLMKKPVERPPQRTFLHRPELGGEIEFKDVNFAYPEQKIDVFRDLSFQVRAGEHVAILGRVGCGKSTLLKLLVSLYQPTGGSILFDGADVAQIDPVDLRKNIGYVSQDVRLFYGSLRENVAMGAPLADDEAILRVARISGLDRLVGQHPMGFDLTIAEGGEGLSGGQKQAVAIARAFLGAPPILLLDEPTSAMDHNSEQAFLGHLKEYSAGKTVILVTHKPTMLSAVDRLLVLDGDKIVADGPRDEILRTLSQPVRPAAEQ